MLMFSFAMLMKLQLLTVNPTYALEAQNPASMCERMIHAPEKQECEKDAHNLKLDWYAASACNAINDDKKFLSCWKNVAGADFNPEALGRCVENPDDQDDSIYKCILSLKNNRVPASVKAYQSMTIQKEKGIK
jgi:hypothetical protein